MVPKQNQLPGAPSTEAKPHSYPSAKWRKKQAAKVPTCDPAEGVNKRQREQREGWRWGGTGRTSGGEFGKGMGRRNTFVSYPPRDLLISNSNSQASNRHEVENERPWETDSPGPPFGPRYLSTATVFSPLCISPFSTASTKASSVSNVLAFPVNSRPSFPVILATAPPGARLPFRILQINDESAK